MIWNLIGVLISGLSMGGIAVLLIKLSRNRLPKWIIPIAAGLGMFSYLAYYDYAWYNWKKSQLPEGSVIIDEQRNSNFFRPWSYIYPAVNYFSLIDIEGEKRTYELEGQHLVEFTLYELYHEYKDRLETTTHLLNCEEAELVKLDGPRGSTNIERNGLLHRTLCP